MTVVTNRKADRKHSNRTIPREQLRQRIADAAIDLFHKKGYDAVTVDEIVARAGVSKGAFFNFFPTKTDVLIVYFHEVDSWIAVLRAKLEPSRPQAALEKFFAKAEALLRKEGALIETLSRAIWANPALLEADRASALRDRHSFAEFFRRAQHAGTIDPRLNPETAGEIMGDLWTGSILLWLAQGRRDKLALQVRSKLQLLFDGLSKRKKR
jgi:AcrR family transcriptional regulator